MFAQEVRAVHRAHRPAASLWAEGGRRLQRDVAAEANRLGRRFRSAVERPFEADELPQGNVPRGHEFSVDRDLRTTSMIYWLRENQYTRLLITTVQSPKKVFGHGLVNFVSTVAYLFCLNILATMYKPFSETLYKELVLWHLVLQLFDDSRKGSTRFVSTGIRPTTIWIYRIKFYKNRLYRK